MRMFTKEISRLVWRQSNSPVLDPLEDCREIADQDIRNGESRGKLPSDRV
jgi:hypothetical protein